MPQTTYPLDLAVALSGLVVEAETWSGRYLCEEDIPAGRVVALNAATSKLRLPRSGDKLLGISPYRSAMDPGGYRAGDTMAVLREGKAWVDNVGTAPVVTALQVPNVSASTTIAADRGKVTGAALSGVAGAEIVAASPGVESVKNSGAITLLSFDFTAN